MKGRVIASSCGTYTIFGENKEKYNVSARGIFRKKNRKIVVGDIVDFDNEQNVINDVEDQKSFLIRPTIANIDQVVIVMSVVEPNYSSFLVDKFITYATSNGITPIVLITKMDRVLNRCEIDAQRSIIESYGYKTIYFSKETKEGLDELRTCLKGKVTALMGQTGVGKSSFINTLVPEHKRLIGSYSSALGRGKHQTKEVVLLEYEDGFIADTPGFSSLEFNLSASQVTQCFPLIKDFYGKCFFKDCLHINEKNCEVKKLVGNSITTQTYENYLALIQEAKERKLKY